MMMVLDVGGDKARHGNVVLIWEGDRGRHC